MNTYKKRHKDNQIHRYIFVFEANGRQRRERDAGQGWRQGQGAHRAREEGFWSSVTDGYVLEERIGWCAVQERTNTSLQHLASLNFFECLKGLVRKRAEQGMCDGAVRC